MDTSGVEVVLTETEINRVTELLRKAKLFLSTEKYNLLVETYAELIRRTRQV